MEWFKKDKILMLKTLLMFVLMSLAAVSWVLFVDYNRATNKSDLPNTTYNSPSSEPANGNNLQQASSDTGLRIPETLSDDLIDRHVVVESVEYSYTIGGTIIVKAGENVRILFRNNGSKPHNITIDKLGVTTGDLSPGEVKSIDVKIPKNPHEKYIFYSSINDDRQFGMEGQILVDRS